MDEITEEQVRDWLRTGFHLTFAQLSDSQSAAIGMVRTLIKLIIGLEKNNER